MKTLMVPLLLASLAGMALAKVEIRRDSVLEAVSESDLSLKSAREGDRFAVRIENDRDLPKGTRVIGEVDRIEPARDREPGYMDLRFTSVEFPGGARERIDAVPITLNAKGMERGRDGRLIANPKKVKTEQFVIGGAVGGLLVGALLKKPFEGAFVGTLAGIVVSEIQRADNKKKQEMVLQKGAKLGVLLQEDLVVENDRDDRWDDRNDDRFESGRGGFEIDGREVRSEPVRDGNQWLLDLNEVSRELGLEVDRRDERVWIEGSEAAARVEIGDREARLNGRSVNLPSAIQERNGRVLVPASLLAALSSKEIRISGTRIAPIRL